MRMSIPQSKHLYNSFAMKRPLPFDLYFSQQSRSISSAEKIHRFRRMPPHLIQKMLARYLVCSYLLHNFHLTLHDFLDYRLHLAALHYNENSGRDQAETKQGEKRYALLYPKYKGGGHIVRKLMEDPTYGKLLHIYR